MYVPAANSSMKMVFIALEPTRYQVGGGGGKSRSIMDLPYYLQVETDTVD